MRIYLTITVGVLGLMGAWGSPALGDTESDVKTVKKAVERSTLDQPGTKPFHLKAALTPSREKDAGSSRAGDVEIWWASPAQYRREVRSPEFHQITIVSGGREWQKNEGDYFPEWLREVAVELIAPVPRLDEVLEQVKTADVKKIFGRTDFSWMVMSTDGKVKTYEGASVDIDDKSGLIYYAGGFGSSGLFTDYENFHGRMVARTVRSGSPEVTAKVTVLEELRDVPVGLFDATASGGDSLLLRTVVVEEAAMRKNLLPMEAPVWPPTPDGPLEGTVTAELMVDRTGKVREIGTIVSTIQGASETAGKIFAAMTFKPYLQDGEPVQVVARMSLPIKTVRPEGTETFDSARDYFERGRRVGFPAAGNGPSYALEAVFKAGVKKGAPAEEGKYVDTWINASEWRREASLGKSRYVRSQHGETHYQLEEGPDVPLLRVVLRAMEPIPAMDTFVEGDWRIKRDTVGAVKTIRVLAGYESPDGKLDPVQARGYWFDEDGKLVKTYFRGIETRRGEFQSFNGAAIAHEVQLLRDGALGMEIRVTRVLAAQAQPADFFELHKHEWTRAFTDEVR